MSDDLILNPSTSEVFTQKAVADPILATAAALPADFAAQYPTPLDTTEILPFCEDITVWAALPEHSTGLKFETWREMTSLAFITGSNLIAFPDYLCPETYTHDGSNLTVTLKNIGAYKSLGISDIIHSAAVAGANWNGINRLVGGFAAGEGLPGGSQVPTFVAQNVADVKAKEIRLMSTLTLNGWDRLLVSGDATTRPLEFDGIENWFAGASCTGENANDNSASGTFSAASFDQFLSEGCAKPTHIFGHPQAIQEMLSAYFQLGFAGSQVVNFSDGGRIVPGFNFAGFVNTGIGRLAVIADSNFARSNAGGGKFQSKLYALRMNHNGEDLVYKITQIPLALKDLAPGCTAIAFMVWAKTALVIKACCAHSIYTSQFTGRIATTCTKLG